MRRKRKDSIKLRCKHCGWTGYIADMKTLRSHPSYGVKAICPECKLSNERDGGTEFAVVKIRRVERAKLK